MVRVFEAFLALMITIMRADAGIRNMLKVRKGTTI
jgi:hypothetical protein